MTEPQEQTPLTARQEAFIAALLTSPSVLAASKKAKIGEATAYRWLKEPHIQEAYQAAQQEVYQEGISALKGAARLAVNTLVSCLQCEETPVHVKVRAADIVLKQAIELHSIQELEARIAELEALVKERSA